MTNNTYSTNFILHALRCQSEFESVCKAKALTQSEFVADSSMYGHKWAAQFLELSPSFANHFHLVVVNSKHDIPANAIKTYIIDGDAPMDGYIMHDISDYSGPDGSTPDEIFCLMIGVN